MPLRWYQREAIDATRRYLRTSDGHPLMVLPTGAGKGVVQAHLMREEIKEDPDLRFCMVTHQKELIAQNFKQMVNAWQGAPVGIYSASIGKRQHQAQILMAGIQSVYNKVPLLGQVDAIIVDEAHLIPRAADTMYGRFISDLQERYPWLRVIGMTATPFRLDSGHLCHGDEALFTEVVYNLGVDRLIDDGWLTPPVGKKPNTQLDLSDVKKSGGDFIKKQLEAAVDQDRVTAEACTEIVAYARQYGLKKWVAFCVSVSHAQHVRDVLVNFGVSCEVISGDMPQAERAAALRRFHVGETTCLSSVGVLTTGFDEPAIDLLAMLRPTASTGLYLQMAGRGLRVVWPPGCDPNKEDAAGRRAAIARGPKPCCHVLDFAGNIQRHGPIDDPTISEPSRGGKGESGPVPQKMCPQCESILAVSTRTCANCGHEFEVEEKPRHDRTASTALVMRGFKAPKDAVRVVPVKSVLAQVWFKPDRPATLCLEFEVDDKAGSVRDWLSIEGKVRGMAEKKWASFMGSTPMPETALEAIELLHGAKEISTVSIKPDGKWMRVVDAFPAPEGQRGGAWYIQCPRCRSVQARGDVCHCESPPPQPVVADDEVPF